MRFINPRFAGRLVASSALALLFASPALAGVTSRFVRQTTIWRT